MIWVVRKRVRTSKACDKNVTLENCLKLLASDVLTRVFPMTSYLEQILN
jgi:hypothetical protein